MTFEASGDANDARVGNGEYVTAGNIPRSENRTKTERGTANGVRDKHLEREPNETTRARAHAARARRERDDPRSRETREAETEQTDVIYYLVGEAGASQIV